jgi:carbon monoxide dehydrogenase subunit G
MAEQTQGSIEIGADAAAIMAVIADYEAYPEWAKGVKTVKVLERGPDGRASKVHYDVAQGPIKVSYTLTYAYAPDDAGVSWTFVEGQGLRDLSGAYELAPKGGVTAVTYRLKADIALPIPGFLKRQGERTIIDTALKGLKRRVESMR